VVVNGVELYKETISLPQMIAVGDLKTGDILDIRIACKDGENSNMTVQAAVLNNDLFRQGYEILNSSVLELIEFRNTAVEGIINCDRDGLLYTSIPQNGNWIVQVDGKPAQMVLVGDVMAGVMLTEGSHTVRFSYRNAAFSLGWKVTIVSAAIFLGLIWTVYKPELPGRKKRTGKFENKR
jgi:uncharacterized membrane protein YfhO